MNVFTRTMEVARKITSRATFWLSLTLVSLLHSPLWAQAATDDEPKERWVLAYALVFLLFGLSLYSITRGSNRRRS
jgi:hypothetical protein